MGSTKTREIVLVKPKKAKITGSSKKGRQHVVNARKCQKQFERTAKNKRKAWQLHLKNHPNDVIAKVNIERCLGTLGAF